MGCDSIVLTNLVVKPFPVVNLSNDTTICESTNISLNATYLNATYQWQDNSTNPVYNVTKGGLYWVKATIGGCSITDSIFIGIDDSCNTLYVPNAFVPDGTNKIFKPKGDFSSGTDYYFAIYNRWGQILFETKDYEIGWNGIYKGEAVQSGIYVYYIRFQFGGQLKSFEKTGRVTLID
jgi:gliding motility-associated-like protein